MSLGILRLTDVITQSSQAQAAESALRARIDALNRETTERERAAGVAEAEARRVADPRAAAGKARTAGKLRREAEHAKREASIEIEELRRELLETTLLAIQPIISEVARERGAEVVLLAPNPGLAYFSPGVDLTDDVAKKLADQAPPSNSAPSRKSEPKTHKGGAH